MRKQYVSLDGGIGNLLFQYSAARTLAAASPDSEIVLVEFSGGLIERLQGYVVSVEFRAVDRRGEVSLGNVLSPQWGRLGKVANLLGRLAVDVCLRTEVGAFDPRRPIRGPRSLFLQGYFQHPSWFDTSLDAVLDRLLMRVPPSLPARLDGVLGVHLRRGDYVQAGFALPLAYYENALDRARSHGYLSAAVVSDDPVAGELLASILRSSGWDILTSSDFGLQGAFGDFHLLGRAEGLILSNSTFSWWAAHLNELSAGRTAGPCFVPEHWICGADHLLDPRWIRVPVA